MVTSSEKPALGEFCRGAVIVYEFGNILFFGVIDDVSMLAKEDRLKVTFYHASDPRFAPHLPKQLWLRGVSGQVRASKLRSPDAAQWLLIKAAAA
ncbi:MAG: hypothetical protein HY238_23145 [Acidobacteria bacterium]|nr:hypothetical protein [Acidobacteriota bacterium]